MSRLALGCIADDITGASDLAALVARSGAAVSLRIGLPAADPDPTELAEVEVIALKIRSIPADQAVAAAMAARDWLIRAGAARLYWKYCSTFDSTAQGNIGPVAQALLAAGTDAGAGAHTLHAPGFPENGRRVFMGNLFVGRQPLAESPMRDHPLNPMRDSDLTRLLSAQLGQAVGLVDWPTIAAGPDAIAAAIGAGPAHLIADTIRDEDLAALAQAGAGLPLLCGGSAFAAQLPAVLRARGELPQASPGNIPDLPGGPALVLSGSCSAMTRRQVAAFAPLVPTLRLDPLRLAETGPAEAVAWVRAQTGTALVHAAAQPDQVAAAQDALGVERAGNLVEEALSAAAAAGRARGVTRFVVAGGESSGAVVQALGVSGLQIGAEIAPGVPWCVARDREGPFAITLKSGNFGAEDFFARALRLSGGL